MKKYFIESSIFSESCTSDCPQFLEDRQKLGELRLIQNGIVKAVVEVKRMIIHREGDYVGETVHFIPVCWWCDCQLFSGTLPRKSSEFKELRASLISRTCEDDDQDDNEEKVCCVTGENSQVDLDLYIL